MIQPLHVPHCELLLLLQQVIFYAPQIAVYIYCEGLLLNDMQPNSVAMLQQLQHLQLLCSLQAMRGLWYSCSCACSPQVPVSEQNIRIRC